MYYSEFDNFTYVSADNSTTASINFDQTSLTGFKTYSVINPPLWASHGSPASMLTGSNYWYTKSDGATNGVFRLFVRANTLPMQSGMWSLYPRSTDLNLTMNKSISNGFNAVLSLTYLNSD